MDTGTAIVTTKGVTVGSFGGGVWKNFTGTIRIR